MWDLPERWTAILNPYAGRGARRSALARVARALGDADLDVAIYETESAAAARQLAADAFASGRGVVASGGDGTVRELADVALDAEGVLGVVPSGSGNDFARHLGIALRDPPAAVTALSDGLVRAVDVGRAETADGATSHFTTVAGSGFDAAANRYANTVGRLSGTPLYVLAVARTLATYRPQPMRVVVDGDEHVGDAWMVAAANTRAYGGGMVVAPDAAIDDGLLDVCIVGAMPRVELAAMFPLVFTGGHVRHRNVTMLRGHTVELDAPGASDAELWASGERAGALPARMTVETRRLLVVTNREPANSPT